MPFYGSAIVCADDPGVKSIVPMVSRPVVTYGFGDGRARCRRSTCRRCRRPDALHLQRRNGVRMPTCDDHAEPAGEHNVRNALAAIAVATELELPDDAAARRSPASRRRPALPALRRAAAREGGGTSR
jgi:UDP-N-acetylmuramate--alanine ligase